MNFEVDFKGVRDKQDIIRRLVLVFGLPEEFHTPVLGSKAYTWNWDAFQDYFLSLGSDSAAVRDAGFEVRQVHLVVKNIQEVKNISEKDYDILLSVLEDETKKESKDREDKIDFTYEIV